MTSDPTADPTADYVMSMGEATAHGAAVTVENITPILDAGTRLRDDLTRAGWSEAIAEGLAAQVTSHMLTIALQTGVAITLNRGIGEAIAHQ